MWKNHRVTLVQSILDESPLHPWSLFHIPLYHVTLFHPYFHPMFPILAFIHIVNHPIWSRVSRWQVNRALYALTREVICLFLNPIFPIFPSVSPSVTLLLSLIP